MLGPDSIHKLIRHSGKMCLLNCILAYDNEHIICSSTSHEDKDNPLRTSDGLSAIHGIEYGAQAIALHGRLMNSLGRVGYLVAVRDFETDVEWLHDMFGPIRVTATVAMQNESGATYCFSIEVGDRMLVSGRLTIAFVADRLP